MSCRRHTLDGVWVRVAGAILVATFSFAAQAPPAQAQIPSIPNPCDLPGPGLVCDVAGDLAGDVAGAAADFVMRGVTVWVTNAAVWVTGKVGEFINATTSPDVGAAWFVGQYRWMLATAGVLALPMLLLAAIQALLRQDAWILVRSAFGYLPMAFILAGAAVVGTDLLVSITDDLSAMVTRGLGDSSDNLLKSVGRAYSDAIEDDSGGAVPLFGVFLGATILAIGAFVLWIEMVIRDAAIYIALFFVPLTFVAMIWPATSRYARRLVEFLIAVILAKFVIVAIIGLASAAITNAGATRADDGQMFERMIAGAALLVLAAWSPFALLRLIPMMEIAAAGVVMQRSSMSGAAGSAGVHSPASYMRQAMDRHSHGSASPGYPGTAGTIYSRAEPSKSARTASSTTARDVSSDRHTATNRSGSPSGGRGGTTYAPSETRPAAASRRGPAAAPPRDESSPQPSRPQEPRQRTRPPESQSDKRPPTEDR
ncbi:MAG: type IV secretion system protein [Gaiellaceae bacterium]